MLVGDMSNGDKRERFLNSDLGKKVNEEYEQQIANGPSINIRTETDAEVEGFFDCYDDDIVRLMRDIRKHGFESYLLPQQGSMPMGYTREDILITKF